MIVKRTVADEEKRGIIKTIPLIEEFHLEVALLYLKEERSNPVVKAFIVYIENRVRNLINM